MQIHYSLRVSSKAAARHAFRPSLPRSLHLHIRACCPMSSLEIITDPFERSGVAAVNSPRRINKVLWLACCVHEAVEGGKGMPEIIIYAYQLESGFFSVALRKPTACMKMSVGHRCAAHARCFVTYIIRIFDKSGHGYVRRKITLCN